MSLNPHNLFLGHCKIVSVILESFIKKIPSRIWLKCHTFVAYDSTCQMAPYQRYRTHFREFAVSCTGDYAIQSDDHGCVGYFCFHGPVTTQTAL